MSIRPSVYPVSDIEPVRDALGGCDASLVELVREAFVRRERAYHEDDLRADDLEDGLAEGEGGANPDRVGEFELDEEGLERVTGLAEDFVEGRLKDGLEPGVWGGVIVLLAHGLGLTESSLPVNEDWKWAAWSDYAEGVAGRLPERPRELLGHLVEGRPLKGRGIDHDGCFYAWLTPPEVTELLAALRQLGEEHPDVADEDFIDGFHEELVEWLEACEGRCLLLSA